MSAAEAPAGRVLVVEDEPINRQIIARGVERLGYEVLTAADGREALDVLEREAVDIVLLDLVMPELDGFAVLDALSCDPALSHLPVLVISAVEERDSIARAIEMGAIDCLPKPLDPVLLKVRVDTALRQRQMRKLEQGYLAQELALRQQEKLVTLGRLSAGLAHELNNPAAAALRAARQLDDRLTVTQNMLVELLSQPGGMQALELEQQLAAAFSTPADSTSVESSATERATIQDRLEDALAALGVARPWDLAPDLAALGLTPADIEERFDGVDPSVAAATLRWRAARAGIRRALAQVIESIERMSGIVGALRSYSYVDRAPQQAVDVRRGLDDTITMLGHKVADGVRIERDYDPALPTIQGMGGQLNQVWTNLLDNAIDAVGPEGRIVVRAHPVEGGVCVEVEDDGPGIPADLLGQIFDPFVTTKEPGQGTGLGLNISHQIVTEGHGGRITVVSEPDRTVFSVQLPLQRAEAAVAGVPDGVG
jgi:signal transduction histidine kinase